MAQRHTTPCQQTIPPTLTMNKRVGPINIGGVLYYGRTVDLTVLPELISIASEQARATENTEKNAHTYWII